VTPDKTIQKKGYGMWFSSFLHQKGVITGDQFAWAVRRQLASRPVFGKLAIQNGLLTMKQVTQVFAAQAGAPEKPFGKLSVELGFLTEEEVSELLTEQSESVVPLREILVEMGVLTQEQMDIEMREARMDWGHLETSEAPVKSTDKCNPCPELSAAGKAT